MTGINVDKAAQDALNAIKERIRNLKTLNIIVAGKTGVGKSTLINGVFRDKLAETGVGNPVTQHMRKLTKKDLPLAIYDTRGLELRKEIQDQIKQEVMDTIKQGLATHDINQAIHCIWYCINTASNRIEPEEIEWIKELTQENNKAGTRVPIIIVLTQSFSKKNAQAFRSMLLNENLNVEQIIPVLAEDYPIDDEYVAKAFGLDALVKIMGEVLPDELLETLQNIQIANLKEKQRHARAAVTAAVAAAAGEGAAPIPFSDAFLLVPTQIGMITSITVIFGLDVDKSIIAALLSTTLGSGGVTILGKTVVSNLIKLIPGVGSAVGGAISATTAGALTAALGEAYIGIMTMIFNGEMEADDLKTKKGKEQMKRLFKRELSK